MKLISRSRRLRRWAGRLGFGVVPPGPSVINWDLTYACPFRCGHCYSESGRRPSEQLRLAQLNRVVDVFLGLRPIPKIVFTGGEPLLVDGVLDLARRLRIGGAEISLYTSGWRLDHDRTEAIAELFNRVAVSLDGADAEVNDFVRERVGAFATATRALELFDGVAADRRRRGLEPLRFGIACTLVRSNWHQLERYCTELAPRFRSLGFIRFGAMIPTGLASRESYVARELLSEGQLASLPRLRERLRRLAPPGVEVEVLDNLHFQMTPVQMRRGAALDTLLKVEADGGVRALDVYEGTVGNILWEPFAALWERTRARFRDPFVLQQLGSVRTPQDWARACRAIDLHFAAPEVQARILRRTPVPPRPEELCGSLA